VTHIYNSEHSIQPTITQFRNIQYIQKLHLQTNYNFYPSIQNCVTMHKKLKLTNSYFKQIYICQHKRHKWDSSYVSVTPKSITLLYTTSFWTKSKPSKDQNGLNASCLKCITMLCIIHSLSMCRMQRFLAVLSSFFHSSLLCNFSCHPSPPTIHPSSLISSCHLFLGLSLNLVVPKFIYDTLLGNSILFLSLYMSKPT